jgi:hypothetical protein
MHFFARNAVTLMESIPNAAVEGLHRHLFLYHMKVKSNFTFLKNSA